LLENVWKERDRTLGKKIETQKKVKSSFLKDLDVTLDDGEEAAKILGNDINSFLSFCAEMFKKYINETGEFTIPAAAIPTMSGMLLSNIGIKLNKAEAMSLKNLFDQGKIKDKKSLFEFIDTMAGDPVSMVIEKWFPGLEEADIERFIKKISNNKELKDKLNEMQKRINRFIELKAKNEYMTDIKEKKPIRV
jgi:hypothetical protein